jgi:hypothetical protein
MSKDDSYVEYAKGRDPKSGQDSWSKLKDFRDPVNGRKLNSTGDWRKESELGKGQAPTAPNRPGDSQA